MAAHAFEQAWRTGTFICQSCHEEVRVNKGARIPECPNGHRTYILRIDEVPGEQPSRGHPRHGGAAAPTSLRAALKSPKHLPPRPPAEPGTLHAGRVSHRRTSRAQARARIELHKPGKQG